MQIVKPRLALSMYMARRKENEFDPLAGLLSTIYIFTLYFSSPYVNYLVAGFDICLHWSVRFR